MIVLVLKLQLKSVGEIHKSLLQEFVSVINVVGIRRKWKWLKV